MSECVVLTMRTSWMDLDRAAGHAGVSRDVLIEAITHRRVRATTMHPDRPGDWMVPRRDVDLWARAPWPVHAPS